MKASSAARDEGTLDSAPPAPSRFFASLLGAFDSGARRRFSCDVGGDSSRGAGSAPLVGTFALSRGSPPGSFWSLMAEHSRGKPPPYASTMGFQCALLEAFARSWHTDGPTTEKLNTLSLPMADPCC